MCWRWRCVAVLLGVALWAAPAAAASIQRFTDGRGVLHISNVPGGAKAKNEPKPAPLTEGPKPTPVLAPPAAAAKLPPPTPAAAPPATNAATTEAAASAPAPASAVAPSTPAPSPSPASPATCAAATPLLPVARVALATGNPAPPVAAASSSASDRNEGSIRRYRDTQGVWHITNVSPSGPDAAPPSQLQVAEGPRGVTHTSRPQPAVPPGTPTQTPGVLKPVSWTGETSRAASPAVSASGADPPPVVGSIRRYRDAQGVLHISNVDPEPAAPREPRRLLAQARPPGLADTERAPPSMPSATGLPFLRPVSWPAQEDSPPAPRPLPASPQKSARVYGGIVCSRDAQGVIRIANAPPPTPPPQTVAPLEMAARVAEEVRARAPAALGPALAGAAVESGKAPPLNPAAGTILAFRDRQGRLTIRNRDPADFSARASPAGINVAELEPIIREAAQSLALPEPLIRALIKVESNFCRVAVSPKGAMGLMQLMPGTATFLGVSDPFCPRQNILGGCRYLRMLLDYFNDSLPLALAAYNAGHQRVVAAGFRIPAIKETQEFVTRVLERYYTAMALLQQQVI